MKALAFAISVAMSSTCALAGGTVYLHQMDIVRPGGIAGAAMLPDVARTPNPPAPIPVPISVPAPNIVAPPAAAKVPVQVMPPASPSAFKLAPEPGKVEFGDGSRGARPPSGADVASRYRRGAGKAGLPTVQNPRKLPAVQVRELKPGAMPLTPLDDPRLSKKKGAGENASEQQLELQNSAQQENRVFQTISNIEKTRSDTQDNVVKNIK
jgi:hypothetical protein